MCGEERARFGKGVSTPEGHAFGVWFFMGHPLDEENMRIALALAQQGHPSPNPMVGAVVVKDGKIVGRGFHQAAGGPHAEVLALEEAGELAKGATLYVTLEPCAHYGRTPPCTEAIISAGIHRVVAPMEDPDPRVRGRGFTRLREAGIQVEVGLLAEEAEQLNAAYLKHRRTGLPLVIVKWAMSLDGKIATPTGESKWITGEEARELVHQMRSRCDAIAVGINTVLRDDPLLTARIPGGRDPLRVVVDSRLRIPLEAQVITVPSQAATVVATTSQAPMEKIHKLESRGVEVWVLDGPEGKVDLHRLLEELGRREILSVLVEGGGTLIAGFVEAGLVDRVAAFVAPLIIGGNGPSPVQGVGVASLAEALHLTKVSIRQVGRDVLIEGVLRRA
ncbi:MAG: bifunctional diaminohydroxyphosphoribosylaminopyrimidine deaminase/5-amino-6-(5-phosphoribosylamino)uracil reductase RibD [Armatimonadota bacterium]|nr:bifunctional diaminohydroxyphosphoribosylaminopyrimidine deaminase/5-amino-6-(5-phosphoribosylamino)uracil reductase RibD [Armatimonadota bacterium]